MKTTKGRGFNCLVKPLVAATALAGAGYVLAITDAGTVIKNLATVTYTDSNNDIYTATSNEAQVVVANVFTATLESDNQGGEGAPGQTVYFPHVLTNTGNGADTYAITTGADDLTGSAGAGEIDGTYALFLDENGNGQPDAGEPQITGPLTLEAGEQANIIVAMSIPTDAGAGDIYDAKLEVTSGGAGTVTDLSPSQGLDGADGTNQDAVTVTLDEVIVTTKSAVLTGNTLTYTLTVKNTGGADATDVTIFDTIPSGATFGAVTAINGLLTGNGDTLYADDTGFAGPADLTLGSIALTDDFAEPAGVDLDGDGTAGEDNTGTEDATVDGTDNVIGFAVRDAILPANTTVSVEYTVTVPLNAGDVYKNRFCAGEDLTATTGDGSTTFDLSTDVADCSNQVITTVPFTFGVSISDNAGGSADDATDDDVENVTTPAGTGSNVDFTNIVTNNGTANDIFDLEVVGDAFPAGTVFTFWESNGNVPLTDNNNNGIPDTGVVGPAGTASIIVRATLPQSINDGDAVTGAAGTTITGGTIDTDSVSGNLYLEKATADQQVAGTGADTTENTADGYDVTVASTADNDEKFQVVIRATSSEDASQIDETIDALAAIALPEVDLANNAGATGFGVAGTDAHALAANPVFVFGNDETDDDGQGNGVTSGNGAGGDDPVAVGQTVYFPLFIANEGPNLDAYELSSDYTGNDFVVSFKETASAEAAVITATPALAQGETFSYFAEIVTTDSSPEGNFDITFEVTSPTSGATDSKLDRVIMALNCEQGITPASQQQIQAGGNVDYVHTFTNNSNATQTFTFGISLSDTDWSSLIVNESDDSGFFAAGDVIADAATVTLAAGQSITFINRVFAPANAISGQTEVSTVTISSNLACGDVKVEDVASVIVGQVRLTKLVSIDDTCNCVADNPFATAGSAPIEPGDCAVWQLTAVNEGDEDADSVVIRDSLTEFTAFVNAATDDTTTLPGEDDIATTTDDSFSACKGVGCTPVAISAAGGAAGGVTVAVAGESVSFDAGTLTPGDSAVGTFCVQVQ